MNTPSGRQHKKHSCGTREVKVKDTRSLLRMDSFLEVRVSASHRFLLDSSPYFERNSQGIKGADRGSWE